MEAFESKKQKDALMHTMRDKTWMDSITPQEAETLKESGLAYLGEGLGNTAFKNGRDEVIKVKKPEGLDSAFTLKTYFYLHKILHILKPEYFDAIKGTAEPEDGPHYSVSHFVDGEQVTPSEELKDFITGINQYGLKVAIDTKGANVIRNTESQERYIDYVEFNFIRTEGDKEKLLRYMADHQYPEEATQQIATFCDRLIQLQSEQIS